MDASAGGASAQGDPKTVTGAIGAPPVREEDVKRTIREEAPDKEWEDACEEAWPMRRR